MKQLIEISKELLESKKAGTSSATLKINFTELSLSLLTLSVTLKNLPLIRKPFHNLAVYLTDFKTERRENWNCCKGL
jgi:hypothetical protein